LPQKEVDPSVPGQSFAEKKVALLSQEKRILKRKGFYLDMFRAEAESANSSKHQEYDSYIIFNFSKIP